MEKQIVVKRETYEKNGKTFYTYFVEGVVRGKTIRATLMPQDLGGYNVLDIVFGDEMQANLIIKPFEIKDEKTGNIFKGNTFTVQSVDENGEVYECNVKPSKSSDKALLNMLIK